MGAEELIEVIGEKGNKKLSLNLKVSLHPEQVIRAELTSTITNAILEGRIISTSSEKSASLLFKLDQNEYLAKVGVSIQGNSARAIYKPLIVYKTPQNSGKSINKKNLKFTIFFQVYKFHHSV